MRRPLLKEGLAQEKFLVVSNREPYIHRKVEDTIKVEKPAGGLTSALDDVLTNLGGLWVAWGSGSADSVTVDDRDCLKVPPENPSYTLKRVWLQPRLVENYYNGYSNQVLWPLCHITLDRVYYRKKFWEAYIRVNRAFAQAVLEEVIHYSKIWIHDYHLCLLPGFLREKAPHLTLAHFWHIPWPDWSVFRVCPQAKEILKGLLGNDLIGFQIPLFGKNFLTCVKECLGAEVEDDPPSIYYQGRTIQVKSFSIGIDFEKFNQMASSTRTGQLIKKIKEKYQFPTYLGIGVDRMDYTKALIKRLQAIELFFEKHKRFRSKMSFFQVAIPTRFQEPYISYKYNVEKLIYRINEKYAHGNWKPIIYVDKKIEHKDLVAYYRMADFAIISSVYDGMNLVAKEFVASQVDAKGVLILSELTGAAEALDGAILVNPYDIEDFSENIKKALVMPERAKKGRILTLRSQVKEEDIYKWIRDFLQEMQILSACKVKEEDYLFNHLSQIQEILSGKQVILFLDYDGTLTPIMESPDQAVLSEETRYLLNRLKEIVKLVIISGRSLEDLKRMINIPGILYVGNHGGEICDRNAVRITNLPDSNPERLAVLLNRLQQALSSIPGAFVEEKGITASVHFRKVAEEDLGTLYDFFWETVQGFEEDFRITKGKKVFEIRPLGAWNKGDAVSLILDTSNPDCYPLYLGDDTTDEDAFEVLGGKGISIAIGRNPKSDYYLKSQKEVNGFLEHLINIIKAQDWPLINSIMSALAKDSVQ